MSETIWERIERGRRRWDVLRHPFYRRWSAGELTDADLARYSGQYRRAVEAIATMSDTAADAAPELPELREHASEERDHVRLWDGFVEASGGDAADAPTPETQECVRTWAADDGLLPTLARLYAIESTQPAISRTKLDGLLGPYGYEEGSGTEYFQVHRSRDVEHAAEACELIERLADESDHEMIVGAAESAFRANWRLLDGV